MDKRLTQSQLRELVFATAENLHIKYPSIIEKDYYVTYAINALSKIENQYFRLIFTGGTCLAKAHRIVKRMSEDIDFKIQLKTTHETLSKNQILKQLKIFRSQIMESLTLLSLTVNNSAVRNEGRHLRVELAYPTFLPADNIVKPHILLECTFAGVHLAIENLTINTMIEDALPRDRIVSPLPLLPIQCVSVAETAIEKWVGLTRRIVAIERQYHYDDKTLVRHLYDLNAVYQAGKINDHFFNLAKTIVNADAKQFKNQHPEYFTDPIAEIVQTLALLKTKKIWKQRYQQLTASIVYDKTAVPDYATAMQTLEHISANTIQALKKAGFRHS